MALQEQSKAILRNVLDRPPDEAKRSHRAGPSQSGRCGKTESAGERDCQRRRADTAEKFDASKLSHHVVEDGKSYALAMRVMRDRHLPAQLSSIQELMGKWGGQANPIHFGRRKFHQETRDMALTFERTITAATPRPLDLDPCLRTRGSESYSHSLPTPVSRSNRPRSPR